MKTQVRGFADKVDVEYKRKRTIKNYAKKFDTTQMKKKWGGGGGGKECLVEGTKDVVLKY